MAIRMATKSTRRKLSPKVKSPSEKLTHLQVSLAKKKECQRKALKVVEMLLDNPVDKDALLENCKAINQAYYKDIVEERAVVLSCGYPICLNKLQQISNQKYHISLKYNKVFDIAERKYFCSNWCFKASKFLEMQLPTSPLWLLDDNCPITYNLLEHDEKSEGLGEEICFEDLSVKKELKEFVTGDSSNAKTESEKPPCPVSDQEVNAENAIKTMNKGPTNALAKALECVLIADDKGAPVIQSDKGFKDVLNTDVTNNTAGKTKVRTSSKSKSVKAAVNPIQIVERCLKEWFTLETLKFLLGPEKYKAVIESKGHDVEETEKVLGLKEAQDCQKFANKYRRLCSKLDVLEKEDHVLDTELTQDSEDEAEAARKKKLPSFEQLAKESEQFRINVEAFYQGKMEVLRDTVTLEDTKFDTGQNHQDSPVDDTQHPSMETNGNQCDSDFSWPLVDNHAQNALRRRIVLDKLNRASTTFFQTLHLSSRELASDMRLLVHTFNLQAHNITFKPAEWTLVVLVILHLLSLKDTTLKLSLEKETSQKCIAILLQSFLQDASYLKQVGDQLMDVDHLIKLNADAK